MPLDPNFAKQVEVLLASAARLAQQGAFCTEQGRWLGTDLVIVIGVGEGAQAINRLLSGQARATKDPRSGGSIIVPP